VAEATLGPIGVANHLLIFNFFLKLGMGAFWEKEVKMVELQQFESLGGSNFTF
jgi:hypothetical protein